MFDKISLVFDQMSIDAPIIFKENIIEFEADLP